MAEHDFKKMAQTPYGEYLVHGPYSYCRYSFEAPDGSHDTGRGLA